VNRKIPNLVLCFFGIFSASCEADPAGTEEFAVQYAFVEGMAFAAGVETLRATGTISVLEQGCEGPALTRSNTFLLGLDGSYRVLISIPVPEGFVGCVEILVEPLMSLGIDPRSARVDGIAFAPTPNSAPNVEIDVVLQ
jgi:hypothetical protein